VSGAVRHRTLYEVLEALPEDLTGEILEDQVHAQPRPAGLHAIAGFNLGLELGGPYARGRNGPGGWWLLHEPEIHFVRDHEVAVPDLAGWRRERLPEIPSDQRFEVVPDWICEILSPSTRSKDREIKIPLYARRGVGHAWLIDPHVPVLEAYELRDGEWSLVATFGAEDTVAVAPFPAACFRLAALWS
jgi:Uma2 family endonuclease